MKKMTWMVTIVAASSVWVGCTAAPADDPTATTSDELRQGGEDVIIPPVRPACFKESVLEGHCVSAEVLKTAAVKTCAAKNAIVTELAPGYPCPILYKGVPLFNGATALCCTEQAPPRVVLEGTFQSTAFRDLSALKGAASFACSGVGGKLSAFATDSRGGAKFTCVAIPATDPGRPIEPTEPPTAPIPKPNVGGESN